MNNKQNELAIVVASCDKFSDMWTPLFDLFFKNWPDCPYPVYLVANHEEFKHEKVITLLAGEDISWSTTIVRALKNLPHSHILFWVDDAFPIAKVDTDAVNELYQWMLKNNAEFLRLRPNPKPKKWINRNIGKLDATAAYRVSLFATIWSRKMLNIILQEGESAWQFELQGTERSRPFDGFYCTKKEIFKYLHGVEKGIWIRSTVKALTQNGYTLDLNRRPQMDWKQNLWYKYRQFKQLIFTLIPEKYRVNVLSQIQKMYKILKLR